MFLTEVSVSLLMMAELHLFASVYWLTVAHSTLNSGATVDVIPNTCAFPTMSNQTVVVKKAPLL